MLKILLKIKIFLFLFFTNTYMIFATAPKVSCDGLPGCNSTTQTIGQKTSFSFITNIIGELIKYVSVIAVIAIMISGIIYIVSIGDENKVKKAKNWIIWSLAGVLLSISAWSIINLLNKFNIN